MKETVIRYEATFNKDRETAHWCDVSDFVDCDFDEWIKKSDCSHGRIKVTEYTDGVGELTILMN